MTLQRLLNLLMQFLIVILLLVAATVTGCNKVPPAVHDLLFDAKVPPSITVDFACDADVTGCTEDTLKSTVASEVPTLPPHSEIRLFAVADDIVASRELYRVTTGARKPNAQAEEDRRRAETKQITDDVMRAAAPLFVITKRHASPIAQTIHRMLLAGNPSGGVHHLVILTDGRQVSKAVGPDDPLSDLDFECGAIPDDFADRLARFFPKDSLRGVHVHFANVELASVDGHRCPDPDTTTYARMRDAWVSGLSRQGAIVTWDMGPIGGLQ